jgi:hypothetical protein
MDGTLIMKMVSRTIFGYRVLTQNGPLQLRNKINASESDLNQAFTLCIASTNAAHGKNPKCRGDAVTQRMLLVAKDNHV